MLRSLIFVVVTTIAIGIGYHEYTGGNLGIFGQSCHRRFAHPFNYMATKTPYLEKGVVDGSVSGDPFNAYHGGSCQPLMSWHLIRHGTRNPGVKVIKTMKSSLPKLRELILAAHKNSKGSLCEDEVEELRKWSPESLPIESEEKFLTTHGEKELLEMSQRFKLKFPHIYPSNYDNSTFHFKFTKTQRAEASAKLFAKGIFKETELDGIDYPTAVVADPVIRFYKGCKKWKQDVDKNPDAYKERVAFETSDIFKRMLSKLQQRLGLEQPLSLDEAEIIHLNCAFESAWNPSKASPWCHVFDEHDFQVLEYRQDIEYYWIDGYGYQLTYEQACPTIEDIVEKLSAKAKDPSSSPSVVAYFTHSGTLLKVIARLGLFNDTVPLLSNNFDHHRSSRKWRMSKINTFATNIAFVLYKCEEQHKVGMLFREQPANQPLCDGKMLCPLNEFKSATKSIIENCDLVGLCSV